MPRIDATSKCNGVTYYITYTHPLGDEQWTEFHYTRWESDNHHTRFMGYSIEPFEIVCDEVKQEAHFVNAYDLIDHTEGDKKRYYADRVGAQLGSYRYFLAITSFIWPSNCKVGGHYPCEVYNFNLYECGLDYTDCNPLPIYVNGDVEFFYMEADELSNEIRLFEQQPDSDEILLFTYSENPQCYVEECFIQK